MEEAEKVVDTINSAVNGFVWGPLMIAFIISVGAMFTVRTGWFQITRFRLWMKETFFAIFTKKSVRCQKDGLHQPVSIPGDGAGRYIGDGERCGRCNGNCPWRARCNFLDVDIRLFRDDDNVCGKCAWN